MIFMGRSRKLPWFKISDGGDSTEAAEEERSACLSGEGEHLIFYNKIFIFSFELVMVVFID
jgi:hypothetical protein